MFLKNITDWKFNLPYPASSSEGSRSQAEATQKEEDTIVSEEPKAKVQFEQTD